MPEHLTHVKMQIHFMIVSCNHETIIQSIIFSLEPYFHSKCATHKATYQKLLKERKLSTMKIKCEKV